MAHRRVQWLAVAALAAGCSSIRQAARLKSIQEGLVLAAGAEETVPEPAEAQEPQGATNLAPMQKAPVPEPPDTKPANPGPAQPGGPELLKECPVDFKRFPVTMQYCPEHGTRLRDLRNDSAATRSESS